MFQPETLSALETGDFIKQFCAPAFCCKKMASMENQGPVQAVQKKGRQLILFPLPFQGHLNPMLQLASILYTQGFSITIVHTKFNSLDPSKYPNFAFRSISDGLSSDGAASSLDILARLRILNSTCIAPFRDCLAELLQREQEEPFACLITDAIWHFSRAVAHQLNLPTIVLRTSSVFAFLAFAATPLLRQKGYLPLQASQEGFPVPELPPCKVKDLPLIESQDPENYHHLIDVMVQQIKASAGIVFNSYEELESETLQTCRQDFPPPIFLIGPFHKYFLADSSSLLSQDRSCLSWLDKQEPRSVLYVSFGSVAAVSETEFQEISWGLANSNFPFLWVVRPGLVQGFDGLYPLLDGFIEGLNGRGYIVKWAPQQEVLAHPSIGAFWTHCGWNSTLESLCEGVPMICQPDFGDQRVNSRYISDVWKVGVHLEYKLERAEIEKAIKTVMVEEEGQQMRQKIKEMKEKTDHCLKQGGSSPKSLERLVNHILSFK